MKKRIYCPFCSMIFGIPEFYKTNHLVTMGNEDFAWFVCTCGKSYWIREKDFDELGVGD